MIRGVFMIKLEKRDGTYEVFDKNKIINAIYKVNYKQQNME